MSDAQPTLRLAVITDLKGYLEPCGCTSRPLGGIDRMAAKIEELRADGVPLFVVAAGDLLFGGSDYDEAGKQQQLRSAETLIQILNRIGVSAVAPGPHDLAHPRIEELTKRSKLRGLAGEDEGLFQARANGADVSIVLSSGGRREINRIAEDKAADFIVQGGLDQDRALPPRRVKDAWVLHAGRQGQGLTVVDVFARGDGPYLDASEWSRQEQRNRLDEEITALSDKISAWEKSGEVRAADLQAQQHRLQEMRDERAELSAAPKLPEENAFIATWHELEKEASRDPVVSSMMLSLDKEINAHNKTALADLNPPQVAEGQPSYVGSQTCSPCHVAAYDWWKSHPHGRAYQTLVERHKEFNLSCVGCHVTGYNEPGGSTVTHNLNGALVNVGCESCHGPGSMHSTNPEAPIPRDTDEATCVGCHNQEHSDLFEYNEYRSRLLVPGHGLPLVVQ